MFIFFYSYAAHFINFNIQSSCEGLPLVYCRSRGLTRAFYQIINVRFQAALALNPYSIKIFLFFLIQLFARISINKVLNINNFNRVLTIDSTVSILFFAFAFYNLIII